MEEIIGITHVIVGAVLFLSILALEIAAYVKAKKQKQKRKFLPRPLVIILIVLFFLVLNSFGFFQRQNLNEMGKLLNLQKSLSKFCAEERRMPAGWKELEAKGSGRLVENGTRFVFNDYWQREIVVKNYEIRFGLSREDVEKMEKPLLIHVKDKWWRHGEDCEYISKTLLKCMQEGRDLYGSIDEEADSATRRSVPKPVPDPSQNSIE